MLLPKFVYHFKSGPVDSPQLLEIIKRGNCRLAVQIFYQRVFDIFLKTEQILLPEAFYQTGEYVFPPAGTDKNYLEKNFAKNLGKLKFGDVLYAVRLRNKKNKNIYKNFSEYKDYNEWLLYLHSAVFLGKKSEAPQDKQYIFAQIPEKITNENLIWHATAIENGSVFWDIKKFNNYYALVTAKRLS